MSGRWLRCCGVLRVLVIRCRSRFRQTVEGLVWRYARDVWTLTLSLGDIVGEPFTLDDVVLGALDTGGILVF
jgi:hypothetical protein